MKSFKKVFAGAALAVAMNFIGLIGFNAAASAACVEYNANGTSTSATPVFNQFCNVPDGVGNEADFVRLRASTGDDTSPKNNADYTSTLNSACDTGSKFDVRTYIHNGASQDFNNNGSGTAVAHNVKLAMTAPLDKTDSSFTFGSTVSASNAASVSDTGVLNCNDGKQVKLTLVPSTVHVYSLSYGWKGLDDSSVNGTTAIGSPTQGSGDQWACWDYRVVVVYEVQVTAIPPKPPVVTATCDLFTLVADKDDNHKVSVSGFSYTAKNTSFKSAVIDWGDGTTAAITDAGAVKGLTHTYAQDGTHNANITVSFNDTAEGVTVPAAGGADSATCAQTVTSSSNKPPVIVPPTTPKPTALVNTGAGSVIGLFAAVSALGAAGYRYILGRRIAAEN